MYLLSLQSIHASVMHSLTCIPMNVFRSSSRVEWLPLLHSIAMMHASLRLRGQVCPYSWSNGYHWNYNHLMVCVCDVVCHVCVVSLICMYACMYVSTYVCICVNYCMCFIRYLSVMYNTCYAKLSFQDAMWFAGKDFIGLDTMIPQGGVIQLPSWAGLRNTNTQVNTEHTHRHTLLLVTSYMLLKDIIIVQTYCAYRM